MQEPQESHRIAVKCILRHLKFKSDHTFSIYYFSSTQLMTYSDSDWAGCMTDVQRLDIVHFLFEIYSHGVRKRRQTESEYKALTNAYEELIWIHSLLCKLGIQLPYSLVLHYDNIGATYLTLNPIFHARTKHIAIDYHFV
jgi:hypothetical protein